MKIIGKTLFGLEGFLAEELTGLGAAQVQPGNRAVTCEGDLPILYKINLWSRLGLRFLLPIAEFKAGNENELYTAIKKIAWEKYISADNTLAVDSVVHHSALDHSLYVSQKAKDAIVDRLREQSGKRPGVDIKNPDLRVHIHLVDNNASVSIDSSGNSLHKRGYRTSQAPAALNEVLAAGLVKATGWNLHSPLIDFMCGSGTILIEAALMAINKAPGLIRKSFGFQLWNNFDSGLWNRLLDEAEKAIIKNSPEISGIDKSYSGIDQAKENAKLAGVGEYINFHARPFHDFKPDAGSGTVLCNPPYGARLTDHDLFELYKSIGDVLKKNYSGWNANIFTANKEAAKHIGLKPSRKMIFYNGQLECRLLKFELYAGSRRTKFTSHQSDE